MLVTNIIIRLSSFVIYLYNILFTLGDECVSGSTHEWFMYRKVYRKFYSKVIS